MWAVLFHCLFHVVSRVPSLRLVYAVMSKSITAITAKELGLSGLKKALIVVQPTIQIRDALDVLSRNGITSLPIYSHSGTQITSIVNLFDILIHLVKDSKTPNFDQEEFGKLSEPLEYVLGLDGDMESYRLFKSYDSDELIDVSFHINALIRAMYQYTQNNICRPCKHLHLVFIDLLLSTLRKSPPHGCSPKQISSVMCTNTQNH